MFLFIFESYHFGRIYSFCMKLNTKIRYGLRTMIEIAMNAGQTGLLQKDIAERQEIPVKYLDKIIAVLKAAEFIVNVGGKKSGYILAKEASNISVHDIYKAFEGRLAIIQCVNENTICCRDNECASQEFWEFLNSEIQNTLINKTLDQLAVRQKELDLAKQKASNYQI